MSYIAIERLPYITPKVGEDGITEEYETMDEAISNCNDLQDGIIIDTYLDLRDIVSLLSDAKFLVELAVMRGHVQDKRSALPRIEEILTRYNKQ